MRRLNGKLVLITLVSLGVLLTVVHFVHSHQMQRNAKVLLRQAERAEQQKDFARAATLLQRYLAYEPDDTDAIARYVLALEQTAPAPETTFKVFLLLEQVLRRQPDRHDLRRQVVKAAIALERISDAISHLEYLLNAMPDQPDLETQLGWCREAVGDYDKSAAALRSAIKHGPHSLDSYTLLAFVLEERLDQRAEAASVMNALVGANPDAWQAYLARARFLVAQGEFDRAKLDFFQAARLAPGQAEVLLAAAEIALQKGTPAEVRDHVELCLKVRPKDEHLYLALARFEMRHGHPAAAITVLTRGLSKLPASVYLHLQLAEIHAQQQQSQESRKLYAWVAEHAKGRALRDYGEARQLMLNSQWQEATDKLLRVRYQPGLPSLWAGAVYKSLGLCYAELGEPTLQLAAWRAAVESDIFDLPASLEVGKALLACHKPEEAATELRKLAALPQPPADTWLVLGNALLQSIERRPGNETSVQELAAVVEQAAQKAVTKEDLPALHAGCLALQGQNKAAVELLQNAIAAHPKEVRPRTAMAKLLLRQGKTEDAFNVLEQARAELGVRFELQRELVAYWAEAGGPSAKYALRGIEATAGKLSATEKMRLLRELAAAMQKVGDKQGAEMVWLQLAAEQPHDLRCRIALFDLYLSDGRDGDAAKLIEALRKIEGEEGIYWRLADAGRCIWLAHQGDKSKLGEARQQLADIARRYPLWSKVAVLQGQIDDLDMHPERANEHYHRAVGMGERSPLVLLRVARWLFDQRRYGEADEAIRLLEDSPPLPAEAARLGAEIALHKPFGSSRAVALALEAVPPQSTDYADLLWRARIEWLAGRPAQAEQTLRQAVKSAGRIPDVWVALVRHLARTQSSFELEKSGLLEEMKQKLPPERLALTLARCHEAAGQGDLAEGLYKQALATAPGDVVAVRFIAEFYCRADNFGAAEPYLRQLIAPEAGVPSEIAAWARQQLALELAAADFDQAIRLLTDPASLEHPTVEQVRAWSLAQGSQAKLRPEALRRIEQTLGTKALEPDEQWRLAQLYEEDGQHGKARDWMVHLLATQADNCQYLAFYIRMLLRQGILDDARFYLARLERLEPTSARTRLLQEALHK